MQIQRFIQPTCVRYLAQEKRNKQLMKKYLFLCSVNVSVNFARLNRQFLDVARVSYVIFYFLVLTRFLIQLIFWYILNYGLVFINLFTIVAKVIMEINISRSNRQSTQIKMLQQIYIYQFQIKFEYILLGPLFLGGFIQRITTKMMSYYFGFDIYLSTLFTLIFMEYSICC